MFTGEIPFRKPFRRSGRIPGFDLFRDARGLQTLEWVALALVIMALLGAIAAYIRSHPDVVGGAVAEAIRSFFARLSETFGPILSPYLPFPPEHGPTS